MSLVPHYLSSDRASQWPGPDEGQQDEQGEDYFAQTVHGGGQLWRRGPGYLDVLLPPPGFSVWDLPSNKLQTTAVALTFTATAGLITFTAAAGMLAILFTGAMVAVSVLLLVTVCTALITLVVTGVPVGYAVWQLVSRYQDAKLGG
ncbi:uncharacterized protein HaLaN_31755 [Haematococcus lacustris]|uniref:Uncharacterized protein n=1 Tax=Haematococcus lacustris TaxID=44745 RepID=A0A6A0AJR7_HAELA|nr:uncharacterized protein HaLaN_31755 [Haematococcus lacustris]